MRNIHDDEIVNAVKNDSKYQIQTTSNDILRQYNYEMSQEKAHSSKKKYFIIGGSFCTLALAATVLCVCIPLFGAGDNVVIDKSDLLIKNKSIQTELATFNAFANQDDRLNFNNLLKFRQKENTETNVTQDSFNEICVQYDKIDKSLDVLSEEVITEAKEVNETILNKNYKYMNEFRHPGEDTPFAKLYFNDLNLGDNENDKQSYEALYCLGEDMYETSIIKESEIEEDEKETKYKSLFKNVDGSSSYIIEKKSELETTETEECYSYTLFNDNSFKNKAYELTYEYETAEDDTKFEIELIKGNIEFNFNKIIKHEDGVSFLASMEGDDIEEISKLEVQGKYLDNSTKYTSGELEIII